jgi:tetratricopeptide (TPR) repeat protein
MLRMNRSLVICLLFHFCFSIHSAYGQWIQTYGGDYKDLRKGMQLFEQQQYFAAKRSFLKAQEKFSSKRSSNNQDVMEEAFFMEALSTLKYDGKEAELTLESFAKRTHSKTQSALAIAETIDHLFHTKQYKNATEFYENTNHIPIQAPHLNDIYYKVGYSYFIQKQFTEAKTILSKGLEERTEHYYPIHYYYALSCFYKDEMDEALLYFRKVQKSARYQDYIPYYLVQILFHQRRFEEAIIEGEQALEQSEIQRKVELSHLVGQSYFELKRYDKALPYLAFNNEHSHQLRLEDFFQLGYCQYRAENYPEAVTHLSKLMDEQEYLGQLAMLYLADAFLNLGQDNAARNAFRKAAEIKTNPAIGEEARISYVKISYALGSDREALQAALSFDETSPFYLEAQHFLGAILMETRDFDFAIATLTSISNPSPILREAYQMATYSKGIQHYNEKELDLAKEYFSKSLHYPISNDLKAKTFFWQGQISALEGLYSKSTQALNAFLTLEKTIQNFSEPRLKIYAHYILGYNHMKSNNHALAKNYFEKTIQEIRSSTALNKDFTKEIILPDALLRLGDCYFKEKDYEKASRHYQEIIEKNARGKAYALFQKAMIKGLQGKEVDKIVLLEQLLKSEPTLEFADEALMEISNTYLSLEKFQQAATPLLALIKYHKNQSPLVNRALLQLGLIAYNQGDEDSALKYYKEVYKYNPSAEESQEALKGIEEILLDKKANPSEYIRFLETLPGLTLSNRQKDSLNYRSAINQYENGEWLVALKSFQEYIQQYPKGLFIMEALYLTAESHLMLNNYNAALEYYEKIIDKGPSQYYEPASEKSAIIVSTYPAALDWEKAFLYYSILDQIASQPEKRYKARLGALKAAYEIQSLNDVIEYAQKTIESPNNLPRDLANAYFLRGKIQFNFQQYDAALEDFNQLIKMDNTERAAEARYLICELYFQRKDYETAEILINQANKESASYPYWIAKSLLLYSKILTHKGDYFNALAAIEAVIENFREDKALLEQAIEDFEKLKKTRDENSRIQSPSQSEWLEVQEQN